MFLPLLLILQLASASRVCTSINVRNSVSSLRQLEGCSVVEGHVQVVLIERANHSDFAPWSFPELREVTEYVLFYRVPGLRRLGQLFPNLTRVGGAKLFLDYGLVVHEMFSLQELGLNSLQEITRGSVIITKNPTPPIYCQGYKPERFAILPVLGQLGDTPARFATLFGVSNINNFMLDYMIPPNASPQRQ